MNTKYSITKSLPFMTSCEYTQMFDAAKEPKDMSLCGRLYWGLLIVLT